MTILNDYEHFGGVSWETDRVQNSLAYQGVTVAHTKQPLSLAMVLGISGGLVAGYFTFEYEGFDPYLHFLTRNTFDPMDKLLARLAIKPDIKQTTSADKGVENLKATLQAGQPALVWVDMTAMPYHIAQPDTDSQQIIPVIVYGLDGDTAYIADRPNVGLTIAADALTDARGRVKKYKYRVMTLPEPDMQQLPQAIEAGLRETINMMVGEPPRKPLRGKFGLDAYQRWADMLRDNTKNGWAKQFAPGQRMVSGLTSAYTYTNHLYAGECGARGLYADFVDEAADVLQKPDLKSAAQAWREAYHAWQRLNDALLPPSVPALGQLRQLLDKQFTLYIEQGGSSLQERHNLAQQITDLKQQLSADFPLDDAQADALRDSIHDAVLQVREAEAAAIQQMQAALG